jgi:hypothetical protein
MWQQIKLMETRRNPTKSAYENRVTARELLYNILAPLPDMAQAQIFREAITSPIQIALLESYVFRLSLLPFSVLGKTAQMTVCSKIIPLCIQRCQEVISPVSINQSKLSHVSEMFEALENIFRDEKLVSCTRDHRVRLVEIILQALPFPSVYYHPTMVGTLTIVIILSGYMVVAFYQA